MAKHRQQNAVKWRTTYFKFVAANLKVFWKMYLLAKHNNHIFYRSWKWTLTGSAVDIQNIRWSKTVYTNQTTLIWWWMIPVWISIGCFNSNRRQENSRQVSFGSGWYDFRRRCSEEHNYVLVLDYLVMKLLYSCRWLTIAVIFSHQNCLNWANWLGRNDDWTNTPISSRPYRILFAKRKLIADIV